MTFNDQVFPARDVTKEHTFTVDAFGAAEFGPLATVEEDRVAWRRNPVNPDPTLSPDRDALSDRVATVTASVAMRPETLEREADSEAVCLATLGPGHLPARVVPALRALRAADVPVVATTVLPQGRLARETYEFEGSEATLQELGCYYSDLPIRKTRVKTIAALAAGRLDDAFERP